MTVWQQLSLFFHSLLILVVFMTIAHLGLSLWPRDANGAFDRRVCEVAVCLTPTPDMP